MPTKGGRAPAGDETAARGARAARPGRALALVLAVAGVLILVAAVVVVIAVRHHRQAAAAELRPSGIPPSVPTSIANLMVLSPVPARPAPGFTLTDQHGQRLTLSRLRGKIVVLEFMDDHCTDICPIVSQEFIDAYHDLGPLARKVVFAAVNVDPYHVTVQDVAQFSAEHQLTTIPGWHFFTGPLPSLEAAWHAYGIEVQPRGPGRDTIHTSAVYFIDPQGTERYLASPSDGRTTKPRFAYHTKNETGYVPADQIAAWGRGIALVARAMSP